MARKDWGAWRTKLINVPGYIEGGHAIKFKDLMKVKGSTLQEALFTTFVFEPDFLCDNLPGSSTVTVRSRSRASSLSTNNSNNSQTDNKDNHNDDMSNDKQPGNSKKSKHKAKRSKKDNNKNKLLVTVVCPSGPMVTREPTRTESLRGNLKWCLEHSNDLQAELTKDEYEQLDIMMNEKVEALALSSLLITSADATPDTAPPTPSATAAASTSTSTSTPTSSSSSSFIPTSSSSSSTKKTTKEPFTSTVPVAPVSDEDMRQLVNECIQTILRDRQSSPSSSSSTTLGWVNASCNCPSRLRYNLRLLSPPFPLGSGDGANHRTASSHQRNRNHNNNSSKHQQQKKAGNDGSGGTMQAKLMLLKYDTHLRIAITSANLYRDDWCKMGGIVWYQDFPYRDDGTEANDATHTHSGESKYDTNNDNNNDTSSNNSKHNSHNNCDSNMNINDNSNNSYSNSNSNSKNGPDYGTDDRKCEVDNEKSGGVSNGPGSEFGRDLLSFLLALGCTDDDAVVPLLRDNVFDLSQADKQGTRLVCSVNGKFQTPKDISKNGHFRLRHVLASHSSPRSSRPESASPFPSQSPSSSPSLEATIPTDTPSPLLSPVFVQASSVGGGGLQWLNEFIQSCTSTCTPTKAGDGRKDHGRATATTAHSTICTSTKDAVNNDPRDRTTSTPLNKASADNKISGSDHSWANIAAAVAPLVPATTSSNTTTIRTPLETRTTAALPPRRWPSSSVSLSVPSPSLLRLIFPSASVIKHVADQFQSSADHLTYWDGNRMLRQCLMSYRRAETVREKQHREKEKRKMKKKKLQKSSSNNNKKKETKNPNKNTNDVNTESDARGGYPDQSSAEEPKVISGWRFRNVVWGSKLMWRCSVNKDGDSNGHSRNTKRNLVERKKGWLFIGSQNFTSASWGRLRTSKTAYTHHDTLHPSTLPSSPPTTSPTPTPSFVCKNYELGVFLQVDDFDRVTLPFPLTSLHSYPQNARPFSRSVSHCTAKDATKHVASAHVRVVTGVVGHWEHSTHKHSGGDGDDDEAGSGGDHGYGWINADQIISWDDDENAETGGLAQSRDDRNDIYSGIFISSSVVTRSLSGSSAPSSLIQVGSKIRMEVIDAYSHKSHSHAHAHAHSHSHHRKRFRYKCLWIMEILS